MGQEKKEYVSQYYKFLLKKLNWKKLLDPVDEIYVTNQLLHLLQLDDYKPADTSQNELPCQKIQQMKIIQLAIELGVIEDILPEKKSLKQLL